MRDNNKIRANVKTLYLSVISTIIYEKFWCLFILCSFRPWALNIVPRLRFVLLIYLFTISYTCNRPTTRNSGSHGIS